PPGAPRCAEVAAGWPPPGRAAGAGAPPVAARTPRTAPRPRATATAPIRVAFPAPRGRRLGSPLLPAGSACTGRTSAPTGPVAPARILRQYRSIRRYHRTTRLVLALRAWWRLDLAACPRRHRCAAPGGLSPVHPGSGCDENGPGRKQQASAAQPY